MREKTLFTTNEAAEFLGISPRTLESWRTRGGGPAYITLGGGIRGAVRYRAQALEAYLDARTHENTSAIARPAA